MRKVFADCNKSSSGGISWEEFEQQCNTPGMQMFFKAVDLNQEEAKDLFRLLDIDDSGTLDPEEFVNGCLRLQGPAKAIDLASFMHAYKQLSRTWHMHIRHVEAELGMLT